MISKAPLTPFANVGILTAREKIWDILQILQFMKPVVDPVVFLNLD